MENAPTLVILAYQHTSLQALMDQLYDLGLHKHCKINGVLTGQMESLDQADLIVATSDSVYQMAMPFIDKETPYMIAKRTLNFAKIKKLLSLPKGSRIYLVNNMKDAAEEAIQTLLDVGIDHHYIPYYGVGTIDPSIAVAVTPGETDVVPKTITHVIDIGSRLFDMTTLFEIYEFFGISTYASNNQLTARYIHSIIALTKDLNREINQSQGLQKSLEGIVDQIEEGMIVYDQANQIISINSQALGILEKRYIDLISEDLTSIPVDFYRVFMQVEMDKENFTNINGVTYYIRKRRIFLGVKVFATIILFEKISRIKNIETNYRKKTNEKGFQAKHTFSDIKTNSQRMFSLIDKAKKMAKSDSTIFIYGETGTGKEVMAQAIHRNSKRSEGPFVAVNLAAISESLVESELFGYEKGAFTGANQAGSVGLFERAHNGTVFLDEIGDASPIIQNRLLRVLQEREIQRVGGGKPIPIDVRVITATNKDLRQSIKEKTFREDLYYRLNILPVPLLPLRERKEDILLLCELFAKEFEEKLNRKPLVFSTDATDVLLKYDWPGNVRELRNTIEYLSHITDELVSPDILPSYIYEHAGDDCVYETKEKKARRILNEKGFLKDCVKILLILDQFGDNGMGRNSLQKVLAQKHVYITEQKLRYRLQMLAKMDLINVGQGRRGSTLNDSGRRFLQYLNRNWAAWL